MVGRAAGECGWEEEWSPGGKKQGEGFGGGFGSKLNVEAIVGAERMEQAVEEAALLREQLESAHEKGGRLQLALRSSEAELTDLTDAYTLVWDELQKQRAVVNGAMAQCVELQRKLEEKAGGARTARSSTSA